MPALGTVAMQMCKRLPSFKPLPLSTHGPERTLDLVQTGTHQPLFWERRKEGNRREGGKEGGKMGGCSSDARGRGIAQARREVPTSGLMKV